MVGRPAQLPQPLLACPRSCSTGSAPPHSPSNSTSRPSGATPARRPGRPPGRAASTAGAARPRRRRARPAASLGPSTVSTSSPSRAARPCRRASIPGQVDGGDPAQPGRGQRQEPGPGADVQHPAPLAREQPVQGRLCGTGSAGEARPGRGRWSRRRWPRPRPTRSRTCPLTSGRLDRVAHGTGAGDGPGGTAGGALAGQAAVLADGDHLLLVAGPGDEDAQHRADRDQVAGTPEDGPAHLLVGQRGRPPGALEASRVGQHPPAVHDRDPEEGVERDHHEHEQQPGDVGQAPADGSRPTSGHQNSSPTARKCR